MDFSIWGHLKDLVYGGQQRPNTVEDLHARIIRAFDVVRAMPNHFQRIRGNMDRRIQACIDARGHHFEQLL